MSDLTTKLQYLADTKTAIKEALVEKGVEVADTDTFRSYADKISSIESGGGDLDGLIEGTITEIESEATKVKPFTCYQRTSLKSVNLPNVTSTGNNAFYGCTSLESVNMPNATTLGNNNFENCTSLKSVNIPNVTNIPTSTFDSCESLTDIDLSNVTSIGGESLKGCGFRKLVLPAVTSLGNYCLTSNYSLQLIDFHVLASLPKTSGSFAYCIKLYALILRSSTIVTLGSVDNFGTSSGNGTPIYKGTGYIYVPRDLVETYQSATNWSTFASQFRALEDYTLDGTITGELDLAKMGITLS